MNLHPGTLLGPEASAEVSLRPLRASPLPVRGSAAGAQAPDDERRWPALLATAFGIRRLFLSAAD